MGKPSIINLRYENYFLAWSHDALECVVIFAPDNEAAIEIATHCYGKNPAIRMADIFLRPSIIKDIEALAASNIKQGYITSSKKIVEYKTRKDVIDEVLADLHSCSSIKTLIKRFF